MKKSTENDSQTPEIRSKNVAVIPLEYYKDDWYSVSSSNINRESSEEWT